MDYKIDIYDLNDTELKDKYAFFQSIKSRNWKDDVMQELIGLELDLRGVKYD
jgi:hypothetical protein